MAGTSRPQTHLAEVVEDYGTGDGTARIVSLVSAGLRRKQDADQAQRKADGKDIKLHPYVTDSTSCPRKVVMSLLNAPAEELDDSSLINFAVGHAVEEAFASTLDVEMLREVRIELPIDDTCVSGRIDFLLAGDVGLIELKSINSRAMSWMLKNREQGKDDHRHQLNLYLHASQLGLLPTPPSDIGHLVYVVKDATKGEPPIHAFPVHYSELMALGDLRRLSALKGQADACAAGDWSQFPRIPDGYTFSKFPCGYCSYRTTCWKTKGAGGAA